MFGFGKHLAGFVMLLLAAVSPAMAAEKTIVAFGDSLTAGYGLAQGDGLVPQLQGWLDARGAGVALLNAGVSGDTTKSGLARLDWTLSGEVDGLILALGSNDMLRGIDPGQVRANLSAILDTAGQNGVPVLLVGFQSAANWGPDYKAEFDAIYPELAAENGTLLMPAFFRAISPEGSTAAALDYLQGDGLHPTREGVALIVEDLGPWVQKLAAAIE